jgi:hypothetical protein
MGLRGNRFVMPASAGIQSTKYCAPQDWIPAFAGMTTQKCCFVLVVSQY